MHGGLKIYRGAPAAARNYVEADRSRADDYYLAEGTGLAERFVASQATGDQPAVVRPTPELVAEDDGHRAAGDRVQVTAADAGRRDPDPHALADRRWPVHRLDARLRPADAPADDGSEPAAARMQAA